MSGPAPDGRDGATRERRAQLSPTNEQLLRQATAELQRAGIDAPRRQAQLLLAGLVGRDRGGLLARSGERLDGPAVARYESWIARRGRREPLQYILGRWEFHGLELAVDHRALIPRPETEGLVDAALALDLPPRAAVADLGTGSGCLALALAVERPAWRLHAIDRSASALALARENARRHGAVERICFVAGQLERPPRSWLGRMDLVVGNPPYVSCAEWTELAPEVREHEPREALVAGATGLEAYAALAPAARALLVPDGRLILELGAGQEKAVRELLAASGLDTLEVAPDLRGIPRVLVARRADAGEGT